MSWQLTSTSLSQQVTGLHPYYYYSVIVSAVTVSAGPYSTAILIQTFSDGIIMIVQLIGNWNNFFDCSTYVQYV